MTEPVHAQRPADRARQPGPLRGSRGDLRHHGLPVPLPVPTIQGDRLAMAGHGPPGAARHAAHEHRLRHPTLSTRAGSWPTSDGRARRLGGGGAALRLPEAANLAGGPGPAAREDKADARQVGRHVLRHPQGPPGTRLTYPLARAAAEHAHGRRARPPSRATPMVTQPGVEITWGEVHVGRAQAFVEAGLPEVSSPTKRTPGACGSTSCADGGPADATPTPTVVQPPAAPGARLRPRGSSPPGAAVYQRTALSYTDAWTGTSAAAGTSADSWHVLDSRARVRGRARWRWTARQRVHHKANTLGPTGIQ